LISKSRMLSPGTKEASWISYRSKHWVNSHWSQHFRTGQSWSRQLRSVRRKYRSRRSLWSSPASRPTNRASFSRNHSTKTDPQRMWLEG
jgi:hypothetical protein